MRVHELAKEIGVPAKDLLDRLHELGSEAKSHMSSVEATAVELIREHYGKKVSAPKAAPVPGEKAVKPKAKSAEVEPAAVVSAAAPLTVEGKVIMAHGPIVVRDLARALGMRPNLLITELMKVNVLAAINERLDVAVAKRVAEKLGFDLQHERRDRDLRPSLSKAAVEDEEEQDAPEDLVSRPAVVTFLGHVDHGKTSLLDRIRKSSVVKSEYGGITQHIGAYTVEVSGRSITFLDTPGHEAFTAMRARGANLTDIAVIVVAADDGVMPQTKEAIVHAKAAGVAVMVAVNKTDLPGANVDRVKRGLQAEELAPEEWGGHTICVEVSAATGAGVDRLLEMILLQSEMLELKANPKRRAHGYVIEAQLEAGTGPTSNLLVKNGTLRVGDPIVCGPFWGRVRALINDRGIKVKSASPSKPVKCLGLSGVPEAGSAFRVCVSEKAARSTAEKARSDQQQARREPVPQQKASFETLFAKLQADQKAELGIILKTDTQGSLEAITHSLEGIKSDKVSLRIFYATTGNITTNDVMLASASRAIVLGFHVAREPGVEALAKREGVETRLHQLIFELTDEVRDAMAGLLMPEIKETIVGHALVKQVFPVGKDNCVAGCLVTDGFIRTKLKVRVKRGNEALFEGRMASLKRYQDHVSEVQSGLECGMRLEGFSNFSEGDVFEFYETEEVKQSL